MGAIPHGNDNQPSGTFSDEAIRPLILIVAGQVAWFVTALHKPERFDRVVASCDTASTTKETSSYSVGMLWGEVGSDYYLLAIVRGRWEAPMLRRYIIKCERVWKPDATLIEDTELGRSLRQELYATEGLRLLPSRARYDKEARLLAQSARFEAGQVHIADNQDWTADYVSELLAFPDGQSDDQVDATSQALDYLVARTARSAPLVRKNPVRRNVVRREPERRDVDDRDSATDDTNVGERGGSTDRRDLGERERHRALQIDLFIPTCVDYDGFAQARDPTDVMVSGAAMSLFQAWQHWVRMAS